MVTSVTCILAVQLPICNVYIVNCEQDQQALRRRQGIGDVRRIRLQKEPNEGLGVSITVCISIVLDLLQTLNRQLFE